MKSSLTPHILYVEDDKETQERLVNIALRADIDLITASNGKEGLALFEQHRPEIILTDIQMEVMDGLEMIRRIKELDPHIIVIVISAMTQESLLLKAINLGITRYIIKPIQKDNFLSVIHETIELIEFRKEKESKEDRLEQMLQRKIEELNYQEKLIAQSRQVAMGEVVGMIAHQWRQPLNGLSMLCFNLLLLIEEQYEQNEEFKRLFDEMQETIQELSKSIDLFNNFLKPSDDIITLSLKEEFDKAHILIAQRLETSNIHYTADIDSSIFYEGNRHKLLHVLLNILNNAVDALEEKKPDNPAIFITAEKTPEWIEITIQDNGKGIPEEILPKIFDLYFSTKSLNGTGLGLYTSKSIIEKQMRGSLEAKNTEEGTQLTIRLPLSE